MVNISLQVQGSQQTITVTSAVPPLKSRPCGSFGGPERALNSRVTQPHPQLHRICSAHAGDAALLLQYSWPENPQGGLALNSNGSNYGVQGFLLDGTENRDPVLGIIVINPTLDSIGELKVTTQNYDAEFGGAAGGIISASTRSGSNNFHGDGFWFRHSDAQQARDPFAQALPDPVTGRFIPSALYSQFGGRLGGPIIKNKLFFFIDYQGLRQRLGTSFLAVCPDELLCVILVLAAGSATCDLSQYITSGSVYRYPVSGGTPDAYTLRTRSRWPHFRHKLSISSTASRSQCHDSPRHKTTSPLREMDRTTATRQTFDWTTQSTTNSGPSAVMTMQPTGFWVLPHLGTSAVRASESRIPPVLLTFRIRVPRWVPTTS